MVIEHRSEAPTKKVRARGISLSDAQYRVLVPLALHRGHTSRSRVVQELIEAEAAKEGIEIETNMDDRNIA